MARKLKLDAFAFQNPSPFGIGAKNTISNGPDDGTLNKMANCFWQPMRHGSTSQAIDNALSRASQDTRNTGELNLGGHGNTGLVETGMGQTGPFDINKIVLGWNEGVWGPQLARIAPAPITQITIWACHTGEGDPGSDLIFAIAKETQRGVRAGTGFLYTDGQSLWWENGTVIQVATPTYRPPAHSTPSPHGFAGVPMEFQVRGQRFGTTSVKGITFTPSLISGQRPKPRGVRGTEAAAIVEKLFAGQTLDLDNVGVAGMITGTLHVDLGNGNEVTYFVYNDRLAVEQTTGEGYYLLLNPRNLFDTFPTES